MKTSPQRVSDLSATNKKKVIRALMESTSLSRREIAAKTGLAHSTVSNITGELLDAGLVYTAGRRGQSTAGRKEELVARNPRAGYGVTVHYTTDTLTVSLVDFSFSIVKSRETAVETVALSELVHLIEERISSFLEELEVTPVFISLSLPNHPFSRPLIADNVSERFNLPTYSLNNVESMAMYYNYVPGDIDASTFSLVYVGTGIGSALVIDDDVYQGIHGNASDLGHVYIRDSEVACRCGRTGCLESFASERVLSKQIQEHYESVERLHGADLCSFIMKHLHDNDHAIVEMIESLTIDLAKGIYNLVALSDPGRVVVVSRLNAINPAFSERVRRNYYQHACEPAGAQTEFSFIDYRSEAGLIGAGIFGFFRFYGDSIPEINRKHQEEVAR